MARHLPHACLASGWGNEPADEFSSELQPRVLRAATLISGPTAAWGTAGDMVEEKDTPRQGQASDNNDAQRLARGPGVVHHYHPARDESPCGPRCPRGK